MSRTLNTTLHHTPSGTSLVFSSTVPQSSGRTILRSLPSHSSLISFSHHSRVSSAWSAIAAYSPGMVDDSPNLISPFSFSTICLICATISLPDCGGNFLIISIARSERHQRYTHHGQHRKHGLHCLNCFSHLVHFFNWLLLFEVYDFLSVFVAFPSPTAGQVRKRGQTAL